MKEAVAQDGKILQFASRELRGDKEVVMHAVRRSWEALPFASVELKHSHVTSPQPNVTSGEMFHLFEL